MPELPEVEVTRLSFADRIAGARIVAVQMGKPLRWPFDAGAGADTGAGMTPAQLVGRRILAVRRRGKYLLLDLSEGLLLVHLGMSGRLAFSRGALPAAGVHDHFDMQTSQGTLRLHDPRRFGAVVYAASESAPIAQKLLGKLGVEPFGAAFTQDYFYQAIRLRHSPIKQVLLSGQPVVGVGNIYASESLFHAGLRPQTLASRISRARAGKLYAAILQVLQNALDLGGSTLRDFANAQGEDGHFQLQAAVYDRAGLPCHVCQTPIQSIRQGQRSTFYCPVCQRP
ncbi:MAG: bifunctional DNA-formamidopyrimidine glycosylase/DNA-(apurinic or apyrimidinic site) lyase [Cytophagales bacterium]|nr:bifunctional DNA-formamidopyrimidine glycosylase/DNA-(apurinic or apyrimidinic site) lyase [Cytophagales bacterium]